MPDEPFMLVSLKEDKAKKLAQVIGNPTCLRILEHLAAGEATESKIAESLGIPLSTVHYNLQQLVQSKLVLVEEFHYSPKGREVNHYKLANKYIIIAPKEEDPGFLDRLRKYVPATILTLGVAAVLKTMQFMTGSSVAESSQLMAAPFAAPAPLMDTVAEQAGGAAADQAARSVADVAPAALPDAGVFAMKAAAAFVENVTENVTGNFTENVTEQIVGVTPPADQLFAAVDPSFVPAPHIPWWQSPMIDWFLVGAVFVLIILVIGEVIGHWRSKRRS